MITKLVLYVSTHTCILYKLQKPQPAQARRPDSEDRQRQRVIHVFIPYPVNIYEYLLCAVNCPRPQDSNDK